MAVEPLADLRMLVRCVVVKDHMNCLALVILRISSMRTEVAIVRVAMLANGDGEIQLGVAFIRLRLAQVPCRPGAAHHHPRKSPGPGVDVRAAGKATRLPRTRVAPTLTIA